MDFIRMDTLTKYPPKVFSELGITDSSQKPKVWSFINHNRNVFDLIRFKQKSYNSFFEKELNLTKWRIVWNQTNIYKFYPKTAALFFGLITGFSHYQYKKIHEQRKYEEDHKQYYALRNRFDEGEREGKSYVTRDLVDPWEMRKYAEVIAYVVNKKKNQEDEINNKKKMEEMSGALKKMME